MAVKENVYWPSDEETKIVPVEIVDEVNTRIREKMQERKGN